MPPPGNSTPTLFGFSLAIDDMQDDASDMLRIFIEVLRNSWNWVKKLIF